MDKNLNIYDGSIIKKFSETAAEIGQYMEDTIESNPEVTAIVKVLKLWFKIYSFLKKADVDHTYPAEIKQFEVWVKELYECGKHTFLTSAGSDRVRRLCRIILYARHAILYAPNCEAYI